MKNGRKFILKLQEDWAYKEEYNEAERRLGSLAWVTKQRVNGTRSQKKQRLKALTRRVLSIKKRGVRTC